MLALRVVNQRHRGLRQAGQVRNFAWVVHAQLHHTRLVRGSQAQQRQWQANGVVEVALGGQRRVAPPCA
jgi:hypothetical protein